MFEGGKLADYMTMENDNGKLIMGQLRGIWGGIDNFRDWCYHLVKN
jgi:hypothetical protein